MICTRFSFVLLMLAMLTACGFQLRGQTQLPDMMAVTYIDENRVSGEPPSELARTLALILESNGLTLADSADAATLVIKLLNQNRNRRILATGAEGEFREYTFMLKVKYTVQGADGKTLVPPNTIDITRDVLYSEADVLGREAGEQITMRDMVSDAAYTILRRIQSVSR